MVQIMVQRRFRFCTTHPRSAFGARELVLVLVLVLLLLLLRRLLILMLMLMLMLRGKPLALLT